MDLSFSRREASGRVNALSADLAVLLVGVAARQAASPTAIRQARCVVELRRTGWLEPVHGAFNLSVAQAIARRTRG